MPPLNFVVEITLGVMKKFTRILAFIAIWMFSTLSSAHEGYWYFVKLSKSPSNWPEWLASHGKATVKISGNKVSIAVFYKLKPEDGFKFDYLPDPSLIFEGVIESNGNIVATAHYEDTDAEPQKLHGRLIKKISHEVWGNKKVLATTEEIVFPYPENFEFYGFSIKYGVNEK